MTDPSRSGPDGLPAAGDRSRRAGTVRAVGERDRAAYAANWKAVIVVDAVLGWAAVLVGLVLANLVGVVLAAAGAAYLVLVWRRLRRWRRLRLERGLPV